MSDTPRWMRLFGDEQAYWTNVVALFIYNVGLMFLGYAFLRVIFPDGDLFFVAEGIVAALTASSCVGIVLHAYGNRAWPARWAFLFSTVASVFAFLTFVTGAGGVSGAGTVGISLLVLVGGVVGMSMHICQGSRRSVFRTSQRHLEADDDA